MPGARGAMRQRCVIERDMAAGGTDAGGNPAEPDWQPHLYDLPCRAWFSAGRELAGQVNAVIEDRRMIVPREADVTEGDRVAAVTDRRGIPVPEFKGPMRIEAVGGRSDHLALYLEAV